MDLSYLSEVHRAHNKTKSGRGAKEKKKDLKAKKTNSRVERHNPRAFSVANIGRTQKNIQRNLDKSQQKEYVPLKDRRVEENAPPSLVVVMGPPGVGKVNSYIFFTFHDFLIYFLHLSSFNNLLILFLIGCSQP